MAREPEQGELSRSVMTRSASPYREEHSEESPHRGGGRRREQDERRVIELLTDLQQLLIGFVLGLGVAFKLTLAAEQRWRRVNAPHLVALVQAGVKFKDGEQIVSSIKETERIAA